MKGKRESIRSIKIKDNLDQIDEKYNRCAICMRRQVESVLT